jgi:uncharacterized protein YegL
LLDRRAVHRARGIEQQDASTTRLGILGELAPPNRPPVKLDGLRFRDLFVWLSKSMRTVSTSVIGENVALQPPGWISTQA